MILVVGATGLLGTRVCERLMFRATLFRGNGAGIGTNYFVGLGTGDRA